jgi:hypothetical protein
LAVDVQDCEQETTLNPDTSRGPEKDDKALGKQQLPSEEAMPRSEMVFGKPEMSPASHPVTSDETNKADRASGQKLSSSKDVLLRQELVAGSSESMLNSFPVNPEEPDMTDKPSGQSGRPVRAEWTPSEGVLPLAEGEDGKSEVEEMPSLVVFDSELVNEQSEKIIAREAAAGSKVVTRFELCTHNEAKTAIGDAGHSRMKKRNESMEEKLKGQWWNIPGASGHLWTVCCADSVTRRSIVTHH